ncbi:SUMO protein smt3 [Bonamia ostreae]|uniref:SUMO protein smt3 n=1 Tax=Bonamia ostreae TaxID=126728 RepID=A0ABV2AT24_9EUKA
MENEENKNGEQQPAPEIATETAPETPATESEGKTETTATETGEQKEEKKSTEHINIKVRSQDNNEVFFKVRKSTPMNKVMEAYCSRVGKPVGSVRFLFEGERLMKNSNAEKIGLEEGDTIDAMVEQTGGRE